MGGCSDDVDALRAALKRAKDRIGGFQRRCVLERLRDGGQAVDSLMTVCLSGTVGLLQ